MRNREPQREFCANNCGARLRREHLNFCSNDCKLIAYRVWLIATWKAGKLPPMQYFNRIIREYLLHTLGEHCQRCGWNERNPFTGKIPLEIEHIDGNWQKNRSGQSHHSLPELPFTHGDISRPQPRQRAARSARNGKCESASARPIPRTDGATGNKLSSRHVHSKQLST